VRLAEEGADIIAVDICRDYPSVGYGMATEADLAQTVKAVEELDRRIVAVTADVRDVGALRSAVDDGVAQLGRLDIVCANAGICTVQSWDEVTPAVWQDTLDTNLTGVWNTIVVSAPHLIAAGGGSIICTSSTAGIKGLPYLAPADGPLTRRSGPSGRSRPDATGLKPLRRRPKQLEAEPTLVQASLGGPGTAGGLVLGAGAPGRPPGGGTGSGAPGITDEPARLLTEVPADAQLDPETIRRARQIAALLSGAAAVRLRAQRWGGSAAGRRRLARLDVLLDSSGENDLELARDLARLGRGRLAVIRGYRYVAPAASGLFAR
jgi:short chain dehydrogenase